MSISTVAVVGANGNLGGPVLQALVDAGRFRVSVLRRASSQSVVPGEKEGTVNVLAVADDSWTVDGLAALLHGQDAVVVCFPLKDVDHHLRLADAAAAAGVRRYIPADFGSVDARSVRAQQLVPLFEKKERVRALLIQLAAQRPTFVWTSIVGGHFFDWGMHHNFLHVNMDTRVSDVVLGDGSGPRSSLSTLARLGEAVVKVLSRGADDAATANRVLFVQSFCVSQNEVQAAVERATAAHPRDERPPAWKVTHIDTEAYIQERKVKADAGDLAAVEDLVFALGVIEGDWTTKGDEYAMDLLGLKDEDLDTVMAKVVAEHKPRV